MALLSWLQQSSQMLQNTPFNPFLSLLFVFIFLYSCLHTRRAKRTLPPSPPRLPILGNLHQLGTLPHRSLHTLSKKYGPLMFLNLGSVPTLVVSSSEMAKEMLKTHDVFFSNRPQTAAAHVLFYGCTDVGFSRYGEYWRQAKKLCVQELLSPKSVQLFQHVREEEIEALIKKIGESCLKRASINLSEALIATSANIVSRCVCGRKFEEEDGKSQLGNQARDVTEVLGAFCFGDFFPSLGWIDVLTGFIPNLKATFREFDALFDEVVEEHRAAKSDGDKPNAEDFMDILLKFQRNGIPDIELSQINVKAVLLDMFVAGIDTTSTTLEWLMAELIKNPDVMKKAQEEVRKVVGNKSKIDMNDINQMDYLRCVVKETLRVHPPSPLSIPRETSTSLKFGGYDIPSKTRVFLNTWTIQRDPTIWERPEEFLPERFQKNPIDFKSQDFELLPFGGGRRGCPGMTFAVSSVENVIANILYWFDWTMPNTGVQAEDIDMSEANGITVKKAIPLHLVPIPCSP